VDHDRVGDIFSDLVIDLGTEELDDPIHSLIPTPMPLDVLTRPGEALRHTA
jgi:hypothetical protein